MSRTRVTARVVAGVAAAFWGWLFFGVQDTLTVFVEGKDFATHYLMESGWGLLFLVLVAVLVGALLAGSAAHLVPAAGLLLTAIAVTALARPRVRSHRLQVDPPLAVLALAAAVPALGYAWRMAHSHVDVEQTVNLDHYPIQAALGAAIVLIATLVAVARDWSIAWLAAATLAVTVAWMGIERAVRPRSALRPAD